MKIKTSKLLAVLCTLAMMVATFVPMLTLSATAAESGTWTLVTDASTLKAGDQIVIACNNTTEGEFVAGNISSSIMSSISTTFSSDKKTITSLPNGAVILTLGGSSGAWTFANPDGKLLGATAVKKVAWGSGTTTWTISISSGSATIQSTSSSCGRFLYNVKSPRFTTYTSNTSAAMVLPQIYRLETAQSGGSEPDTPETDTETPACEHEPTGEGVVTKPTCTDKGYTTYTCSKCGEEYTDNEKSALNHQNTTKTTTAATCTENGSITETCDDCGEIMSTNTIPAAHDYVDGFCSVCGAEEPAKVTLTFDSNKTNRTEYSTSRQIWAQNGITFTNNKSSSTTDVADYGGPVRLYSSSAIIININTLGNITQIVFDCNNNSYAIALANSIGASATANSDKVTVTLDGTSNQFTVAKLTAQVRLDSLTVAYEHAACEHTNEVAIGESKEPTCTETGITAGKKCADCDHTIEEQEVIPATGHNYVDGICTECNKELQIPELGEYVFDDYAEGTQFAENESHKLDELLTVITNKCHFTTELRIYSSDTYNGNAILQSVVPMYGLSFNAGNKADTVNVYGWENGEWVLIAAVEVTSTSYNDYTVDFGGKSYTQIKLDVAGANQVRIKSITVQYAAPGKITNASLELGTDLSFNYRITIADGESYDSFKMVFTLGDKTVEAITSDGEFKLNGIAPHQMGDTVTATLYKDDVVVDTLDYSIKAYLDTIINGEGYDEKTVALAEALLIYGAAAQKHQNYKTDALVTDETPVVDSAPESNLEMTQNSAKLEGLAFKTVGVHFNYVNKLYITLENTNNVENVTVKVNGVETEIVDGRVLTDAIAPANFNAPYTFVLYVNGEAYQTVTYSVNSYISAKWDAETGLAKALYNYSVAFAKYKKQ